MLTDFQKKIVEFSLVGAILCLLSIFGYYDATYDLTKSNISETWSLLGAISLLILYYFLKEKGII